MATAYQQEVAPRHRALVVDDSQIARHVLVGLLARLGFDADVAESAEAALRQLTGPLPDVVFMDHLLPGIDGLTAVRRLRSQPRTAHVPIVMFTSQDGRHFAETARIAGANDVLLKTAKPGRLGEILRRLDLMPASGEHGSEQGVVRLRAEHAAPPKVGVRPAAIGPAQFSEAVQPIMQAHYDKLRNDLLAEFVILERFEQRMRRDLFTRTETLARRSVDRIDACFAEQSREHESVERRTRRRSWAIAAGVVLTLSAGLAMTWRAEQRSEQLALSSRATISALKAQVQALGETQTELVQTLAALPPRDPETAEASSGTVERQRSIESPPAPASAATALISELQSMGILGPVRIETSAGSFCVTARNGRLEIEASNLDLQACESLPVDFAFASR